MESSELFTKHSHKDPHNKLYILYFKSPIGNIIASADDNFIYFISFEDSSKLQGVVQFYAKELKCQFVLEPNKLLLHLEKELEQYFSGHLKIFSTPIKINGSDFQKDVWENLQKLPYATTKTYGGLAKHMGRSPGAARALGNACGANNHLLIIPCHRVIASNSNGGFSCGIERKKWLLDHEKKYCSI